MPAAWTTWLVWRSSPFYEQFGKNFNPEKGLRSNPWSPTWLFEIQKVQRCSFTTLIGQRIQYKIRGVVPISWIVWENVQPLWIETICE